MLSVVVVASSASNKRKLNWRTEYPRTHARGWSGTSSKSNEILTRLYHSVQQLQQPKLMPFESPGILGTICFCPDVFSVHIRHGNNLSRIAQNDNHHQNDTCDRSCASCTHRCSAFADAHRQRGDSTLVLMMAKICVTRVGCVVSI